MTFSFLGCRGREGKVSGKERMGRRLKYMTDKWVPKLLEQNKGIPV
jgi:hypothetical protein